MGGAQSKGPAWNPGEERYILVMGTTGAGISSFINEVSGSNLTVGDALVSCTKEVAYSNAMTRRDRKIRLIDLPGFDNDDDNLPDEVILVKAKSFLLKHARPEHVIGIIYLWEIQPKRLKNSAVQSYEAVRKAFGKEAATHVVVVTTKWDAVTQPDEIAKADRRHEDLRRVCQDILKKSAIGKDQPESDKVLFFKHSRGKSTDPIVDAVIKGYIR